MRSLGPARGSGARLHLLHAVHSGLLHALTPLGVIPYSLPSVVAEGARWCAEESLARIAERSAREVEVHLMEGPPTHCIWTVAERIRADLIVMGTHGRRGLTRALLGSVAERTLRRAPCPVLTVRARGEGAEPDA